MNIKNKLVEEKARYHPSCHVHFFRKTDDKKPANVSKVITYILTFLNEHADINQFSLGDLIKQFETENPNVSVPTARWIKQKLLTVLDENIFIATNRDDQSILCRRQEGNQILIQHFKEKNDSCDSCMKKITEAADIIIEDNEKNVYNNHLYPAANNFFESLDEGIPNSLKFFLKNLVFHKKKI